MTPINNGCATWTFLSRSTIMTGTTRALSDQTRHPSNPISQLRHGVSTSPCAFRMMTTHRPSHRTRWLLRQFTAAPINYRCKREHLVARAHRPVLWQVRKVRELIEASLGSKIWLQNCASRTPLSTGHVSRTCEATFGTTVIDYIHQRRIERAQHLMPMSAQPLWEIAHHCDFADQAHYCPRLSGDGRAEPQRVASSGRASGAQGLADPSGPILSSRSIKDQLLIFTNSTSD